MSVPAGTSVEAGLPVSHLETEPPFVPEGVQTLGATGATSNPGLNGTLKLVTPYRMRPTAIYDPVGARMIVYGGWTDTENPGDVRAMSLAGNGSWARLDPGDNGPGWRYSHSAIYDPVRQRMIIFAGQGNLGTKNDVWAFALSNSTGWTQLFPAGTAPTARVEHVAIYDPVRDRMLVMGGCDGQGENDVWALSLSGDPTWTQVSPVGTPPSPRCYHHAIYDPVRDRMVVFGGAYPSQTTDTWVLSLSGTPTWTQLSPSGTPPPTIYGTVIYDPTGDRLVYFGGYANGYLSEDTWTLSLGATPTWTQIPKDGYWGWDLYRYDHAAIYDPPRNRMVIFGGYGDKYYPHEVMALTLTGTPLWSEITPIGSMGVLMHFGSSYDPVRDRWVMTGGEWGNGVYHCGPSKLSLAGDMHWLSQSSMDCFWCAAWGSQIYDSATSEMVAFGGSSCCSSTLPHDQLWALPMRASSPPDTCYMPSVGGVPPSPRISHSAVYDPIRHRMVLFGGFDGTAYSNDVWVLSMTDWAGWTKLTPTGIGPAARGACGAVYDVLNDRMLLYGGHDATTVYGDVWALSFGGGPTWAKLNPTGTPPRARYDHSAMYDLRRNRMVIYGGRGSSGILNDMWSLCWNAAGQVQWSQTLPAGGVLPGLYGHSTIYDPVRDRMIIFGGRDGIIAKNNVWTVDWNFVDGATGIAFALESSEACADRAVLVWRTGEGSGFKATAYRSTEGTEWRAAGEMDPDGNGRLSFVDRAVEPGQRYGYRLGVFEGGVESYYGETWLTIPERPGFELSGLQPNPASRGLSLAFSLPDDRPSRLELIDVHGRRVVNRDVGALGAGRHVLKVSDGTEISPGVYWIRLTHAGQTRSVRGVVR